MFFVPKMVSGYAYRSSKSNPVEPETVMVTDSDCEKARFVRFTTIDNAEYCQFAVGRTFYFQLRMHCRYPDKLIAHEIETITDVVNLLESPNCNYFCCHRFSELHRGKLTHHDTFDAHIEFTDDNGKPKNRFCLRVDFYMHSTVIEITEVIEFDEDKNRYTSQGYRGTRRFEDKRGRKPLEQFRNNLWESRSSWRSNGNIYKYSANKRNGRFEIYGC